MSTLSEHDLLLREAAKIVEALAGTFAPLCEVVLHDLRDPDHAIARIENNLSGRSEGEPATELGLARIADPDFPDMLVGYPNRFPDGRAVKSTSIGIRDSSGTFVAAICLNVDISYLRSMSAYLEEFTGTRPVEAPVETLAPAPSGPPLEDVIRRYASQRNKEPRALSSIEKRALIAELEAGGYLRMRGAADTVARLIGGSRSSVYYYLGKS